MSASGTFTYANPPVIHWGQGSLARLDNELRRVNATRAFVVTTRSVASNSMLMGRLRQALGACELAGCATIGQHAPAASVAAAVSEVATARADALVSFGGGSPIDAAKSIAFALKTGLELSDPNAAARAREFDPRPGSLLPHIAIPTTLSAAELSGLAGFTTEGEHEKVGLRGAALVPNSVIYDAELTLETPLELWLATGMRAVDHAVETLLASGDHPLPDTLALDSLRRLANGLRRTRANPADCAARTESQLGAWFSFTLPLPAASGLSHTLGKRIGARHGIAHGVCSCLLLPHVLRYLAPRSVDAQRRIAHVLDADTAADGVSQLIADLGLPCHLADYGLSDEDLVAAARPVATDKLPLDDLIGIYRAAM